MERQTAQINVEINGSDTFEHVKVVQGDADSNIAEISLFKEGEFYPVPSGKEVVLRGTKPDGHQVFNNCEVTEKGTVLVKTTEQISAVVGRSKYEICIYNTDESNPGSLTTGFFYIIVVKAVIDSNTIASSDEFSYITNVVAESNSAINEMNEVKQNVIDLTEELNTQEALRQEAEAEREQVKEDTITAKDDAITATNNANSAANTALESASKADQATADAKEAEQNRSDTWSTFYSGAQTQWNTFYSEKQTEWSTLTSDINTAISNTNTATTNANDAVDRVNAALDNLSSQLIDDSAAVENKTYSSNKIDSLLTITDEELDNLIQDDIVTT